MLLEPVKISDIASEEIQYIMKNKGIPEDYSLRIGIKGGGCGAMGYMLGFDKMTDGDIAYLQGNIPIIIDKKHVMYMMGLEVDFLEDAEARGFHFQKPER